MTTFRALALSLATAGAILFASARPANAQWYSYGYPGYSFGYGYPSYYGYGAVGGPIITPAPAYAPGAYNITYPSYYSYGYNYPSYWSTYRYPGYYYRPGYYSFFRY